MDQNSGIRPASTLAMASWRRLEPADGLYLPRFIRIVLLLGLAGIVVQLAFWLPKAKDYVGIDPDDTMRLVEIRDYLAGQGWFDLHQYRLGLDGGTLMHWSRLIDWPIAQLIRLYGLVLAAPYAEAAALATWPLMLILPLFGAMGLASYRLGGRPGLFIGLILSIVFLTSIVRFQPGAIDHHNVQLVLVAFIAAMLIDPLARASNFAAAAVAGAIALAIGAETTPLVAVSAIAVALLWAIRGQRYRRAAIGFGLGFALVTGVIFFATTPSNLWSSVTCDTLSVGYLALSAAGGLLLAASAVAVTGKGLFFRFAALGVIGLIVLGLALAIAPQCLKSPLDGLDPLLKTYWISTITEAQPITAILAVKPEGVGTYYAVGLIGALVCLMRIMRREQPAPYVVLLGMIGISWIVAALQVRGMMFSNVLAFLPLSALIADLRALYLAHRKDSRAAIAFALSALLSVPSFWSVIGVLAFPADAPAAAKNGANANDDKVSVCVTAGDAARVGHLPAGRILASFNDGPTLLRYTRHSIVAANYHRDQQGMVAALRAGMTRPDDALSLLEEAGIRYLVICRGDPLLQRVAEDYPDGLFAALSRADIPGYLEEVPGMKSSDLHVYEMIQR